MKILKSFLLILSLVYTLFAQTEIADPVSQSALSGLNLPENSYLVRKPNIPTEISQMLARIIKTDASFKQGSSEVFVLKPSSGKSGSAKLRAQLETDFRNSGWEYEIQGQEKDVVFFTAIKRNPARKNIFGFWIAVKDNLMLAMTEVLNGKTEPVSVNAVDQSTLSKGTENQRLDTPQISNNTSASTTNSNTNTQTFNLSASDDFINVMGDKMPNIPSFTSLPKKPGFLRGFVKDSAGRPLQGAKIGVRSTMDGGYYSGAAAESDAKGYYEILLPRGAIHLYESSYTADYGSLRARMSLHAADGRLNSFASIDGNVENFVLLPYGIADRDRISTEPNGAKNYYGGAVYFGYNLAEINDSYAPADYIKENSEIEITLSPEGNLFDGTTGNSLTIRKNLGTGSYFYIYNIPVGKYSISARLVKGNKPLLMSQSVRNRNTSGITPREAIGKAVLIFEPDTVVTPGYGSWNAINLNIKLAQ